MSRVATLDDLRRVLTRYEGAVQEVERDGNEDELPELEAARAELMSLLEQCKVALSD